MEKRLEWKWTLPAGKRKEYASDSEHLNDRKTCESHPVQHVSPALHGDTLEHSQHGKQEVVKVCDAIVGPMPTIPTHNAIERAVTPMTRERTGSWILLC